MLWILAIFVGLLILACAISYWKVVLFGILGTIIAGPIGLVIGILLGIFIHHLTTTEVTKVNDVEEKIHPKSDNTSTTNDDSSFNEIIPAIRLVCAYAQYNNSWTKDKVRFVKSVFEPECTTQKDLERLREILKESPHNIISSIQLILKINPSYEYKFVLFQCCAQVLDYNSISDEQIINALSYLGEKLSLNDSDYMRVIEQYIHDHQDHESSDQQNRRDYQHHSSKLDEAFKLLELDKSASKNDVIKAFRKKIMQYHPDRNPNVTETVAEFLTQKSIELTEAKELILTKL